MLLSVVNFCEIIQVISSLFHLICMEIFHKQPINPSIIYIYLAMVQILYKFLELLQNQFISIAWNNRTIIFSFIFMITIKIYRYSFVLTSFIFFNLKLVIIYICDNIHAVMCLLHYLMNRPFINFSNEIKLLW